MDFWLSDDERALQDGVRSFLAGRFPMDVVRANEHTGGGVDRDAWRALAELGVFSLRVDGFGLREAVLVFEELGRALVPGPLVATHLAAGVVDGAADGRTLVGVLEPAEPVTLLEHPSSIDAVVVLDGDRCEQISPADLATSPVREPLDALTPCTRVVGPIPSGPAAGDAAIWQRDGAVLTAALQVGLALGATDLANEYAKHREQFGRPIGSFQAVKHLLADMLVKAEVARSAVYAAACAVDGASSDDPARAAHVAKAMAGEAALFAGKTGIQVHGGMGFTWEVHAQRYWKRAVVLDTNFGNTDHHAAAVAALL